MTEIPTIQPPDFTRESVFAVCIFTYGSDARALGQCLRALELTRAAWPGLRVAVFDDGRHPLPYAPVCDFYQKTYFPRLGNLNGRPCVQGEIICERIAARKFNAVCIVKLDCDTIVRDWGWMMDAFRAAPVGQVGMKLTDDMDWASGMCNAVRADVLHDALKASGKVPMRKGIPEDIGITACICAAGHDVRLIRQDQDPVRGWDGICTGYDYQNKTGMWHGWILYMFYPVVTFGNRNLIKDKERAREIVGEQMEKFLDVLEGGAGGLKEGELPLESLSLEEAQGSVERGEMDDYMEREDIPPPASDEPDL